MKKTFISFLLFFFVVTIFASEKPTAKGLAEFDIGRDNQARQILKPTVRFEFPLLTRGRFFLSLSHYQTINKGLEGIIDFWVRAGAFYPVSEKLEFELSINHTCRHVTSAHALSNFFDANELLARGWYRHENLDLGFGIGKLIGNNQQIYGEHNGVLVGNLGYRNIFNSRVSFSSELKLINWSGLLWDADVSFALNSYISLFVKSIKPYLYEKPMVYAGLRLKSYTEDKKPDGSALISFVMAKAEVCPAHEDYKSIVYQTIGFEKMLNQNRRFAINLSIDVPVLKGQEFFGNFWPDYIAYPLLAEYEWLLKKGQYVGVYFGNYVRMPVDIQKEPIKQISLGLIAKNQKRFEMLDKSFRYELAVGRHFAYDYELAAKLGLNTLKEKLNLGLDAELLRNSDYSSKSLEAFLSAGKKIQFRLFARVAEQAFIGGEKQRFFSAGMTFIKL